MGAGGFTLKFQHPPITAQPTNKSLFLRKQHHTSKQAATTAAPKDVPSTSSATSVKLTAATGRTTNFSRMNNQERPESRA